MTPTPRHPEPRARGPLGEGMGEAIHNGQHSIETGWSSTTANAIRATCRDCGAYVEAWCSVVQYDAIRAAERRAASDLSDCCCPTNCTT